MTVGVSYWNRSSNCEQIIICAEIIDPVSSFDARVLNSAGEVQVTRGRSGLGENEPVDVIKVTVS
jgi:hypothetical protein